MTKPLLTKLLPEQISTFWDIIKYAIENTLPPIVGEHPDKLNRILSAALSGKVSVWAVHTKHEEGNKFEAIALTNILYDEVSETKNLLIYCLYGYNIISKKSWEFGIRKLAEHAKAEGCNQIVAYTTSSHIVNMVNKLGGNTEQTFISFDVNKFV